MATMNAIDSNNPIQVARGGTGDATLTAHGVLVGEGTGAITPLSVGTNGQVLIGASAADPAFATLTSSGSTIAFTTGANSLNLEVVNPVSAPVTVPQGGTGRTTLTTHGVLVGEGTAAINQLAVGSNGQVLLGSTGADPVFATLTSTGGTITYTTGAGTLNLEAASFAWSVITANQTAAVNNGYICNKAGTLALALPTTSAVGSIIEVTGINTATGWQITQAAGQQIFFGTSSTTSGATGTLTSSAIRDSVRLVCVVANLTWNVISSIGNITVV